ncbi:hypothetical protein HER21_38105 [Pseudomonas sp. BGM005]|nr:hypothetical protein [Pseudomonas sp. BG5]
MSTTLSDHRKGLLLTAIGGASLLGVLGILIVLRRRKEDPVVDQAEAEREGGLLNRVDPHAETTRVG